MYTLDTAITRCHDNQAVWHKDVLEAMNMRRMVQCYARLGKSLFEIEGPESE